MRRAISLLEHLAGLLELLPKLGNRTATQGEADETNCPPPFDPDAHPLLEALPGPPQRPCPSLPATAQATERHVKLREAKSLELSAEERRELIRLSNARSAEVRLAERSRIVLLAADGAGNKQITESVRVTSKTVRKWIRVYQERRALDPRLEVAKLLADEERPGRPDTFSEIFWVDVLKIATAAPENYGVETTHWTSRELTKVIGKELVQRIHFTTVAEFLRECTLQPHRIKEWLNRKADPEFDERATDIKQCLVNATKDRESSEVVVSFDEKTGMQAKERIAPDRPMRPGEPAKLEFEYERHGTLVLFGMMLVHSGAIVGCTRPNRTNPVTAAVIGSFLAELLAAGSQRIHVLLDQLNTHWSHELVETVAKLCDLPIPSPQEIEKGPQRRAWLSDPDKPIVFHFTPKHASWLNPIEIWFGVLARKVLRRGSFRSTEDLEERIARFIAYYNKELAHPYRFKLHRRAA